MEDFNYLLQREQTELILSANTSDRARRAAHMDMARAYAVRIASHHLPYRTPSAAGTVRFNPGRFGVGHKPSARLFRSVAK